MPTANGISSNVISVPKGGVGMLISEGDGEVVVSGLRPDGPAAKADILSGDIIEQVNGRRVKTAREVAAETRGEPGTKVRLLVRSGRAGDSRLLELVREEIPPIGVFVPDDPDSLKRADPEALNKIILPANPTRLQARRYISDIVNASSEQNIFSSDDPQVEMLARVGREHLDLLLDNVRTSARSIQAINAIKKLATDEDRDLVVSYFVQAPELIEIIQSKRWEGAARGEMLRYLQTHPDNVSMNIVLALASLQDPSTYDDLIYGFSHAWGQIGEGYKALENLPGFDLKKAVNAAWEVRLSRPQYGKYGTPEEYAVAALAARCGHRDALDYLFQVLAANVDMPSNVSSAKESILAATNAPISPEADLLRWYEEKKAKLRYDETARRFQAD